MPKDYILASADVKNLFTNISLDATLQAIDEYWSELQPHTSLNLQDMSTLISFLFENSFFKFNGKFYKQKQGTAMGNPASPIYASLVMNNILRRAVERLGFDLPFLYIYVDDIITAIPRNRVDHVVGTFNSIHPLIEFTVELETDNSLPFLDVTIFKTCDNVIKTNWHQKEVSSKRFLNYNSDHPMKHRAEKLSEREFDQRNFKLITEMLVHCNYPRTLINRVLYGEPRVATDDLNHDDCKYYRLPSVPGLTSRLISILKTDKLKIVTYNNKNVGNLFSKLKDQVDKLDRSGLVYRIDCKDCECCYVGQTKQYFKTRLKQHENDCKNKRQNNLQQDVTALASHARSSGHSFDFDAAKILKMESHYRKRCILEMLFIKSTPHSVNLRSDTDNLSSIYSGVIALIPSRSP